MKSSNGPSIEKERTCGNNERPNIPGFSGYLIKKGLEYISRLKEEFGLKLTGSKIVGSCVEGYSLCPKDIDIVLTFSNMTDQDKKKLEKIEEFMNKKIQEEIKTTYPVASKHSFGFIDPSYNYDVQLTDVLFISSDPFEQQCPEEIFKSFSLPERK